MKEKEGMGVGKNSNSHVPLRMSNDKMCLYVEGEGPDKKPPSSPEYPLQHIYEYCAFTILAFAICQAYKDTWTVMQLTNMKGD
jgi:hypothetical protein